MGPQAGNLSTGGATPQPQSDWNPDQRLKPEMIHKSELHKTRPGLAGSPTGLNLEENLEITHMESRSLLVRRSTGSSPSLLHLWPDSPFLNRSDTPG